MTPKIPKTIRLDRLDPALQEQILASIMREKASEVVSITSRQLELARTAIESGSTGNRSSSGTEVTKALARTLFKWTKESAKAKAAALTFISTLQGSVSEEIKEDQRRRSNVASERPQGCTHRLVLE